MPNASSPNVLFIICDDLAWGDLACHGNPYTRTPHLDRMHGNAARLTGYRSGTVCTPARASVMTGRYPYRTRAIDTYLGRSMMDPDEVTLANVLQDAGYRTGLFGKWHLGDCYPMRPMDKGFEEQLSHNGGGLAQPGDFPGSTYFDPVLFHNGEPTVTHGYCSDVYTDASIDFIRQHQDERFFVYMGFNCPHSPFQVPDELAEPYRQMKDVDTGEPLPEKVARLYGMVQNIDENVGRLFATLDELGLTDDTIVVFTSDHGPCGSASANGKIRWNGGLRGSKSTMFDGGLRVPALVHYPRQFAQGVDIPHLANPVDWLPTFASVCGGKTPADRTIDGVDLSPALKQGSDVATDASPYDRHTFFQWHRGDEPVRYRNYAVISQQWKLTQHHEDAQLMLFDLANDPGEQTNLADQQPERVEQMKAAYNAWFDDVSAERPDNYACPRIHIGADEQNPVHLTRQDWRVIGPDGWDDNAVGGWELHVAKAGPYRIDVRLPNHPGQGSFTLKTSAGDVAVERPLHPGDTILSFTRDLPAGDLRLDTWLQLGDEGGTNIDGRRGVQRCQVTALG